jgi:hypothetical protein
MTRSSIGKAFRNTNMTLTPEKQIHPYIGLGSLKLKLIMREHVGHARANRTTHLPPQQEAWTDPPDSRRQLPHLPWSQFPPQLLPPSFQKKNYCHREATRQRPAMATAKIAPSMLSSDFAHLASEAERMLRLGADWLHMDIMVRSPYSLRPIPSPNS